MASEILTEELLQELLSRPNVDSFLDDKALGNKTLRDALEGFIRNKGLAKADVIHKTNLNETHAYQIFSGDRGASRNKVLQIALAMNLDLRQTNQLLHSAGVSSLYCKNRRDAIIIFCIDKSYTLQQTDETLYKFGEATLSDE